MVPFTIVLTNFALSPPSEIKPPSFTRPNFERPDFDRPNFKHPTFNQSDFKLPGSHLPQVIVTRIDWEATVQPDRARQPEGDRAAVRQTHLRHCR